MFIVIKKTYIYLVIAIVAIITIIVGVSISKYKATNAFSFPTEQCTIVIDAGHGGFDPGKVGVNEVLEKDINLSIAKILQGYLTYSGANVIMTREDDNGLYDEGSSNKKRQDMNRRKEIINSSNADILVSIHQNSFSQSKYKGAQVFYYHSSEEGKRLAQHIQEQIKIFVDEDNNRKIKSSNSYYMLKQTNIPGVIVECGFLSNYEEAELLSTEEYQDKIAWAIYIGILKYLQSS